MIKPIADIPKDKETPSVIRKWQPVDFALANQSNLSQWSSKIINGLRKSYINLRLFIRHGLNFSSLGRTIFFSNMVGLAILLLGILYLNQLRAGLVGARVESLQTQGEIIAGAIAASATADTNNIIVDPESLLETGPNAPFIPSDTFSSLEFPIDPERVAPILRRLVQPTGTRARIYDSESTLIIDSRRLYSGPTVRKFELPPATTTEDAFFKKLERWFKRIMFYSDLPLYKEDNLGDGKVYDEVGAAMAGTSTPMVRVNLKGKHVVSVAVPIRRLRRVLGVLLLSAHGGDIEQTIRSERRAIMRLTIFAIGVSLLTSLFLTRYIAHPMRRLSAAAIRVGESIKAREEIPDFTSRKDEIGQLSASFREMTASLYRRLDSIETFAADVSHELKNPLTSLRSAAETLELVKDEEQRSRLIEIIQSDVKRLDRLISDISDASRLDVELAREDTDPVNIGDLLEGTVNVINDLYRGTKPNVELNIKPPKGTANEIFVRGHESRLSQVINNLLDNAVSFSPSGGKIWITAEQVADKVRIYVEDEGPGISEELREKIFKRFYTDRPEGEEFGNNSGLGLNISKQIIFAHKGNIWAENRYTNVIGERETAATDKSGKPHGARFVIELPVMKQSRTK